MIVLRTLSGLNWGNVHAVAWGRETLVVGSALLAQVRDGRARFQALIDAGVACYGVTTGLGNLLWTQGKPVFQRNSRYALGLMLAWL